MAWNQEKADEIATAIVERLNSILGYSFKKGDLEILPPVEEPGIYMPGIDTEDPKNNLAYSIVSYAGSIGLSLDALYAYVLLSDDFELYLQNIKQQELTTEYDDITARIVQSMNRVFALDLPDDFIIIDEEGSYIKDKYHHISIEDPEYRSFLYQFIPKIKSKLAIISEKIESDNLDALLEEVYSYFSKNGSKFFVTMEEHKSPKKPDQISTEDDPSFKDIGIDFEEQFYKDAIEHGAMNTQTLLSSTIARILNSQLAKHSDSRIEVSDVSVVETAASTASTSSQGLPICEEEPEILRVLVQHNDYHILHLFFEIMHEQLEPQGLKGKLFNVRDGLALTIWGDDVIAKTTEALVEGESQRKLDMERRLNDPQMGMGENKPR